MFIFLYISASNWCRRFKNNIIILARNERLCVNEARFNLEQNRLRSDKPIQVTIQTVFITKVERTM